MEKKLTTTVAFVFGFLLAASVASASGPGISYPPKQVQDEGSALAFEPSLNCVGSSIACTDDSANLRTTMTVTAYNTVADEGVSLAQQPTLNLTGAGVTCVNNGGSSRTDCTIPGGGASPLTTKGDLYTFSTVDDRLGVGADNLCLVADSTQATGLKWASCAAGSGLTFGEVQRLVYMAQ